VKKSITLITCFFVFYSLNSLAEGFGPASPGTVDQFIDLAEKVSDANLADTPGDCSCGPFLPAGEDVPDFKARASTFEEAQVKSGLKCIRYRCSFDSPEPELNSPDCHPGRQAIRALMDAGMTVEEATGIIAPLVAKDAARSGYRSLLDCKKSGLARILAYDLCFGVAFTCDGNEAKCSPRGAR
jgi:hypothetical protein